MARHLFIVSRHHLGLYEYLIERFAGDAKVTVILDRRVGDRRQANASHHDDRRGGNRRAPRLPDDDLTPRGPRSHLIVTLDG